MDTILLKKLEGSNKKWKVYLPRKYGLKTIEFGDSRYEDYTQHKDFRRKELYLIRHKKKEDWNNIETRGFWSRWLLWNRLTILESIRYMEDHFGLKIELIDPIHVI